MAITGCPASAGHDNMMVMTAPSHQSGTPIVALRGVGKTFPSGTIALAGLDLDVREGEFLSLLGPSGCGKSTALRIIAGLTEPTQGVVDWTEAAKTENENRLGFVFQEPTLMPWANVADNVLLPLKLKGVASEQASKRVAAALDRVGLQKFGAAYPRELSGGMRMRVSIARALVTEPALLLMDEPFAALDEITRFKLNNDLLQVWQALRTTVVFVTHSVFEFGLFVEPHRGDGGAAGPGLHRARDRRALPARPGIPHLGRLCGAVPAHLGRAGASHGGGRRAMTQRSTAQERRDRVLRVVLPITVLALSLAAWELVVRLAHIPPYVLPAPSLILQTFIADRALLTQSLLVTLITTLQGFLLAAIGGVGLAVLFNLSRLVEYSFYPFAVILQVTPIVAVAPLLLIYLPQPLAVLACAWIVAFFPVLANTTLGLNSIDRNLADLFALYGASRGQMLWNLKLPSALPYILGGLRIAGGLSLIGAVVAEIAAGSAGAGSGLAYRIVESGYRLNIPRMFAALVLLSIAGIVIFYLLAFVNHIALRRWHESALEAGN